MRAALLAALAVCAAEGTAPSTATTHYVSDHGLVNDTYSTPQEWVISCAADNLLSITVFSTPLAYTLKLDGRSLGHGVTQGVACPSSWNMSLLYTPDSPHDNTLEFKWHTETFAARPTVHNMPDTASVRDTFSTPQEWVISCTPDSFMSFDAPYTPIGYSLELDGSPLSSGSGQQFPCPSSGKISLLYTPYDGDSDYLDIAWSVTTPYMSDRGVIYRTSSAAQKWVITCTPHSSLSMTVTELAGRLTTDTMYLTEGETTTVPCPTAGEVKLSYVPSPGTSKGAVRVKWVPVSGGEGAEGLSSLLIALIATAGLLVLVGVTVAVYCVCRGKASDPNARSSNVQVEGYADVVHTEGFEGLGGVHGTSAQSQPLNEMELLAAGKNPV